MRVCAEFLLLAWIGGTGLAAGAETWFEVKTPNFTVVSNAGEGTAQGTASEFEQVRAAYAKVLPWVHLTQSRPTVVLVLNNTAALRRWAPGYFVKGGIDVVSGSVAGADREYVLLRTDSLADDKRVTTYYNLYRAYLALLLSTSLERRLPLWLSSGLSDVLGNITVRDKDVLIGRPVPWEFRYFNQHGRLPLKAILDARRDSPLVEKEDQRDLFDAQCYVLVHYLLFGDRGTQAAKLNRFQELWLAGRTQDQALSEAFGDLAVLEQAQPRYATSAVLSYAQIPIEAKIAAARPPARPMASAEVAGLQAAVHVAMGRQEEARAAIREGRGSDPRSPVSYDAEGLLADRDNDRPLATQAYAQAVELGSTNAHSYYRAAQLSWTAGRDVATLAVVRQRLERAIELNASYASAYSFLADVLVQQGDGRAAVTQAQRAVDIEPGMSYHRLALARALQQLGRTEEARRAAQRGLELAEDDTERSRAERVILSLKDSEQVAK
jgi:tetratricopeptide (TPR) repeat protein